MESRITAWTTRRSMCIGWFNGTSVQQPACPIFIANHFYRLRSSFPVFEIDERKERYYV